MRLILRGDPCVGQAAAQAAEIGTALQLEDGFAPLTTWRIFASGSPMLGFLEASALTVTAAFGDSITLIPAGILMRRHGSNWAL